MFEVRQNKKDTIKTFKERVEQQNNTRDQLRTFIGISPANEEYVFHNIKQFSLEHNLSKENVSATIRGVNKTCSGWKFYEKV